MKKLLLFLSLAVTPLFAFAEDVPVSPAVEYGDMYNMAINLKVANGADEKILKNIKHTTVSGKPVTLNLSGGNFKAAVRLTLYHIDAEHMLLLTQSTICVMNEGRKQVLSTAKSMPVKMGEKVLYFPLGVLPSDKAGYSCMLEMDVSQYQRPVVKE